MSPAPPDEGYSAHFTADAATASRMATSYMKYRMGRPQVLIGWPVVIGALLIWGVTQDAMIGALVTAAVLIPVVGLLMFRQVHAALRSIYPPGSVHNSAFGPDSMTLTGPLQHVDLDYASITQAWSDQAIVLLRRRTTKVVSVIPIELFPDGALGLVKSGSALPERKPQH